MPEYGMELTGAWAPSEVVEVVTRFARRLNQDVAWSEIEQLLVLVNQVKKDAYIAFRLRLG